MSFRASLPRCAAPFVTAAALLAVAAPAMGQASDGAEEYTWHRSESRRVESPQTYALEIRLGPYRPKIDEEFAAAEGPYEKVFGNSRRWHIGVELDWQALRIPYVGTVGPGFGWGYTRSSANAMLTGTNTESAEKTSLWIMPMYVAGVARIDVLAKKAGIPLVPYVKLGLGYALWKTSDGSGTSEETTPEGDTIAGKGHSYGTHFAPGIMLMLDWFDEHRARQLDNSVGVNHSYLFLEWMTSNLDGFGSGDQMRVGTSTWVTGLALEF